MKNVSILPEVTKGRTSFKLLGPDGIRIVAFDAYANSLLERPYHTRRTYCYAVAAFFDYAIEASTHWADDDTGHFRLQALECLTAYREYLVFGGKSGHPLAQRVNSTLPSPLVKPSTCETMHAGLKRFLELSATMRAHASELCEHGLLSGRIDSNPLLLAPTRAPSSFELQAMRTNSMLSGVISGGPRILRAARLAARPPATQHAGKTPFPFQYAVAFLESLPSARDRALYALSAACGCRISEALQLLWPDVGATERSVRLVDFRRRENDPSYLALTPLERDRLAWKGRVSELTLMLEPFESLFFEALEEYLGAEYMPHGRHQFVFQYCRGPRRGDPYFLCADSTRAQSFRQTLRKTVPSKYAEGISVHSFRHMYGTYLLNYLPRADGSYGLPIALVKILMGHANIASTEVYARRDIDLVEADLAYANELVFGRTPKSLNELRADVLLAKLASIEAAIASEHLVEDNKQDKASTC
jgi:integrase